VEPFWFCDEARPKTSARRATRKAAKDARRMAMTTTSTGTFLPVPGPKHISGFNSSWTPGVFYTCSYNHARRLRLEKLLYIELSRSSDGYFKPLLNPGGGFTSETAVT
jgi:hypothetical protein